MSFSPVGRRRPILAAVLIVAACLLVAPRSLQAAPANVYVEHHGRCVLYEPAEGSSCNRDTMPLVVYLHGAPWFVEPLLYDTLLRDVAADGCVVGRGHADL